MAGSIRKPGEEEEEDFVESEVDEDGDLPKPFHKARLIPAARRAAQDVMRVRVALEEAETYFMRTLKDGWAGKQLASVPLSAQAGPAIVSALLEGAQVEGKVAEDSAQTAEDRDLESISAWFEAALVVSKRTTRQLAKLTSCVSEINERIDQHLSGADTESQ